MDKWEAQYQFWSSFGIPAYEENSVPDAGKVELPYITYQSITGTFDSNAYLSASIWSRSSSWVTADTIANSIEKRLANGGEVIPYEDGIIWVTPGEPLIQSMGDPVDREIKRKIVSVVLHFH